LGIGIGFGWRWRLAHGGEGRFNFAYSGQKESPRQKGRDFARKMNATWLAAISDGLLSFVLFVAVLFMMLLVVLFHQLDLGDAGRGLDFSLHHSTGESRQKYNQDNLFHEMRENRQ
jgi:hypothetical protein